MSKFKFIMAGDPQYPWTLNDDKAHNMGSSGNWHGMNPTAESYGDDADKLAEMQVKSMNTLLNLESGSGAPIKGVMFNGDLVNVNGYKTLEKNTELGAFKSYYGDLAMNMYCGLGNHDYCDNVDDVCDTYENRGATSMLEYIIKNCETNNIWNTDYKKVEDSDRGVLRTTYSGSFSYSFNIEHVHFVQLHYFPGYTKSWENFRTDRVRRYVINITDCYDWLEKDLAKAHSEGRAIIVAHHFIKGDYARYTELFKKYGVSAIFIGHNHTSFGRTSDNANIPVFYCGSTSQSNYILLEIDGSRLTATAISSVTGGCQKIENAPVETIDLIVGDYQSTANSEGFVKLVSGGGYTVKFTLKYTLNGIEETENTGRMLAGSSKEYTLPAGATDFKLSCLAWNGSSWKDKFDTYRSDIPFNCTYRTYGALPNPKMEITKDYRSS